ncbi:MAG TPA: hypothetical protein VHZ76_02200 [Gammaproteobacteria bacterium]|jgi:hypothetical protein|nr:hypothetical protein [Gammaproteobacteria bacterium]
MGKVLILSDVDDNLLVQNEGVLHINKALRSAYKELSSEFTCLTKMDTHQMTFCHPSRAYLIADSAKEENMAVPAVLTPIGLIYQKILSREQGTPFLISDVYSKLMKPVEEAFLTLKDIPVDLRSKLMGNLSRLMTINGLRFLIEKGFIRADDRCDMYVTKEQQEEVIAKVEAYLRSGESSYDYISSDYSYEFICSALWENVSRNLHAETFAGLIENFKKENQDIENNLIGQNAANKKHIETFAAAVPVYNRYVSLSYRVRIKFVDQFVAENPDKKAEDARFIQTKGNVYADLNNRQPLDEDDIVIFFDDNPDELEDLEKRHEENGYKHTLYTSKPPMYPQFSPDFCMDPQQLLLSMLRVHLRKLSFLKGEQKFFDLTKDTTEIFDLLLSKANKEKNLNFALLLYMIAYTFSDNENKEQIESKLITLSAEIHKNKLVDPAGNEEFDECKIFFNKLSSSGSYQIKSRLSGCYFALHRSNYSNLYRVGDIGLSANLQVDEDFQRAIDYVMEMASTQIDNEAHLAYCQKILQDVQARVNVQSYKRLLEQKQSELFSLAMLAKVFRMDEISADGKAKEEISPQARTDCFRYFLKRADTNWEHKMLESALICYQVAYLITQDPKHKAALVENIKSLYREICNAKQKNKLGRDEVKTSVCIDDTKLQIIFSLLQKTAKKNPDLQMDLMDLYYQIHQKRWPDVYHSSVTLCVEAGTDSVPRDLSSFCNVRADYPDTHTTVRPNDYFETRILKNIRNLLTTEDVSLTDAQSTRLLNFLQKILNELESPIYRNALVNCIRDKSPAMAEAIARAHDRQESRISLEVVYV